MSILPEVLAPFRRITVISGGSQTDLGKSFGTVPVGGTERGCSGVLPATPPSAVARRRLLPAHSQAAQGQTVVVIDRAGENPSPAPQQVVPLFQHQTSHVARSHTSCRTGNARSSCWQRLQASRIDRLSALGASPICALGYSLQGGFNLVDFGSLSLAYNFECFLIFKFNGLVLGISREQFV
jgi:hypothetical protein